jgi:sugar lactone lactonase YvrE
MHKAWRDGNPGRMYSLAPGGQLQPIMQSDSIGLPNGMAWDTQKRVMYFADTGERLAVILHHHQTAVCLLHAKVQDTAEECCA